MFIKILLKSDVTQIELIGQGHKFPLNFSIVAPDSEASFIEELIIQEFGTTRLNPNNLYTFLTSSSLVQSKFDGPILISGSLSKNKDSIESGNFNSQPLGRKLVLCGLLSEEELNVLLDEFQPFSYTQRFGEFLKLNLNIPFQVLDFFLSNNPSNLDFNSLRLGERLVSLGLVSESTMEGALEFQCVNGGRIGDILVSQDGVNPKLTDFFAGLKLTESGKFIT